MIAAIAGASFGQATNLLNLSSANKVAIGQIKREGSLLASNMKMINRNREQLDRELGDILSSNALSTAKNMATAKVLMSTSGTVGGTSSQVSKQAYMEQILSDADGIKQARNQEMALLNEAVSRQINYRNQAESIRSTIKSPLEAAVSTMSAAFSGASAGSSMGGGVSSIGTETKNFAERTSWDLFGSTTVKPSMSVEQYNARK